jgi:tetratricopeptide (TPR) repeat protein
MADAFFNEMQWEHLVSDRWNTSLIKSSNYYRWNWGFTELDSLKADLNIRALKAGWPFQPDSVVNRFIYTYKPVSMVDSIAHMCVLYDNVSIGDKHRDLAKIYLSKGDKRKAFNEYYALIKFTPYNTFLYYEALKLLNDLNDYPRALDILLSMPNHDTIYFANLQIGQLYQHLNEHQKAIQSFEKAKKLIAKDDNLEALLIAEYNSCEALPDPARSAAVLKEIHQVNPGFQAGDTQKKEVVVYLDKEVRDLIQGAMQQVKQQKFSEALALLEKSLKIKETAFALQLMGNIYIQLNDNRALPVLERAHVIDPKDLKTINNLFVIYLRSGNYDMASQMLEEYKLLSPDQERIKNLSNLLNKELSKR